MNHEIVLAALRLLTGLFGASKAFLELHAQRGKHADDGNEKSDKVRSRPRHLKK